MPHICVQALPMRPHSHSKNSLGSYYCKTKSHHFHPAFSATCLSTGKKKKEYKHPKVRLIHFKHKLKPPAIIFAKFLNPLYCKAELHILYAFFTFPFGDLYRAWRLELSREMLLTCVHNHVEIKILYIQEYTAKRKSEVRMGKDKIILLIVC